MSKINQIQNAIRELSGGAYQKLMDAYLYKRFDFSNIMPLGSHTGTDKTTKGTPDSYVLTDTGKFILIAYGTVEGSYSKIEKDILSCLDESKTGISVSDIEQIICCHTSTNITPGQYKKLGSHFLNTLLIGIGDVSLHLSMKYPGIAKDYLSIEIDTHQIFDSSEYIEYASRNPYSPPLNSLLICREKEVADLIALLDTEGIIMICGKSGVGKTHLALEVAELFGKTHNYNVKIIKSNNESIYDDLQITFTDDKNYLVVVDDADQLLQLSHLIDLSISYQRVHTLKIIMTVRDYAKEQLFQKVKSATHPALFSLEPLDDKSIKQILRDILGITNNIYVERIQKIAKSNVRLAMMAGKCALEGSFESIKNAFDIFDGYFSSIIGGMNRKEIITATLIALFDSLTLNTNARPIQLALEKRIQFDEFVEICEDLHHKEIVSIFNDLAVKFEDQNLRDYLLYYVFFKTKRLTPSYIILQAFPEYKSKIVYAFNTLMSLFETKENLAYVEQEIVKAWRQIKTQSDETVIQFVEVFHQVIPDESLLVIKRQIDLLPQVHTDFHTYDFEKTSNNHTTVSNLIELLPGFKYTRYFEESLQSAFYYLERNTENPMDFYFLFGENLGFNRESYRYGFVQERLLIDRLIAYYKEKGTIESVRCLTFCVSYCLKYDFSSTESTRNNTVTFFQFGLPSCKEVFEIRFECFKALSLLFCDQDYEHIAVTALMTYHGNLNSDDDKEILEQDMIAFNTFFYNLMDITRFEHCTIIQHFHAICERHGIRYPELLTAFRHNRVFMLYLSIKKDWEPMNGDWTEAERERKQIINDLSHRTTDEEFDNLWTALEEHPVYQNEYWDISSGIGLVFQSLAKIPDHFITIVDSFIHHGTPYGEQFTIITSGLIELIGYDAALEFVVSREFIDKRKWLAHIYNCMPVNKIKARNSAFFIEKLLEQQDEATVYTLSLSTVYKIEAHYPGFIAEYVEAMNNMCGNKPWVLSEFMSHIDAEDSLQGCNFIDCFENHLDVLESAYINALHGRHYFDYHGELLIQIIQKDTGFISTLITTMMANRYPHSDSPDLSILWDQDNYDELITLAMDVLKENPRSLFSFKSLGTRLLAEKQGNTIRCERQQLWIKNYIITNHDDLESMKFIFRIISNLSDEQRTEYLLFFCQHNFKYSDFKAVPKITNNLSWSGSEVPLLEQQIAYLENLRNALVGFVYIEHRAYLAEYIQSIREKKEKVLLEEFIEPR